MIHLKHLHPDICIGLPHDPEIDSGRYLGDVSDTAAWCLVSGLSISHMRQQFVYSVRTPMLNYKQGSIRFAEIATARRVGVVCVGVWGDIMETSCSDCSEAVMPHDTYCGACGTPLKGAGRRAPARNAFASTVDDILPLQVPTPPRTSPRRAIRIATSAVAIGLVLILGLGALAVAMNQLDESEQLAPAASTLQRYGAEVSMGGGNAVAAVIPAAELVRHATPEPMHARAIEGARVSTHQQVAQIPATVVTVSADVPEIQLFVIDLGAKDVATAVTHSQMAIAKAPMTRSHPGDGTGGVMVVPEGDGTAGIVFLSAP